jgi:hypothetical protein
MPIMNPERMKNLDTAWTSREMEIQGLLGLQQPFAAAADDSPIEPQRREGASC